MKLENIVLTQMVPCMGSRQSDGFTAQNINKSLEHFIVVSLNNKFKTEDWAMKPHYNNMTFL